MIGIKRAIVVGLLGLLAAVSTLSAREFRKAPAVVNPLRSVTAESSPWMPAGYFSFEHWRYGIRGSDFDLFEVRTSGAATVFQHRERFGVGFMFASILTSGPGPDGWQPPTEVEWRMDAVQFEYGIHLAYRIGSVDLLGEYSRSSFHPFRDDADENYRINTADYVRFGVMPPPVLVGPVELEGFVRTGWLDLFDVWGAPYARPRAAWKTTFSTWAEVPVSRRVRFFTHLEPELLFLRGGGVDVDLYTAAGLRLPGDFGHLDLFLHYTRIGDVEELNDAAGNPRPFEVNLIGLGVRFAAQPPRAAPVVLR